MKHFLSKTLLYFYALAIFTVGFGLFPTLQAHQALAIDPVSQETLDAINPLTVGQTQMAEGDFPRQEGGDFTTLGGVINRVISFIFPLAVLVLFVMLFWAGFEMFSGATDKGSLEKGKNRATMAIAGFVLLFVTYWLIQLIETIFGIVLISFA